MRWMRAEAYPLTKAGQGRDPIDGPRLTLGIVVYGILALAALCVIVNFFAGQVPR